MLRVFDQVMTPDDEAHEGDDPQPTDQPDQAEPTPGSSSGGAAAAAAPSRKRTRTAIDFEWAQSLPEYQAELETLRAKMASTAITEKELQIFAFVNIMEAKKASRDPSPPKSPKPPKPMRM